MIVKEDQRYLPLTGPTAKPVNDFVQTNRVNDIQTMADQSVSFLNDTIPAAFRTQNDVTSLLVSKSIRHVTDEYDENYFPENDLGEYEGTEYENRLLYARNKDHMAAIKEDIARETVDQRILTESGWAGIAAQFVAGVASPTVLLPAGAIYRSAKGVSLLKTAASGAVWGGVAAGASELALQASQQTRSAESSAMTVAAGTVLGGILGSAAGALSKPDFDELAKRVVDDMAPSDESMAKTISDLSAAASPDNTLDDLALKGKQTQTAANVSRIVNPFNRLMTSPFRSVRETAQRMLENPLATNMNAEGRTLGIATETEIKTYAELIGRTEDALHKNFTSYKKRQKQQGETSLTAKQFSERVSRALRNNDVDADGIEEVTQAAQVARKQINVLKDEAIKLGILPEDVSPQFAESYLFRMWSREKLLANPAEAKNMLQEWARDAISKEVDRATRAMSKLDNELEATIAENNARIAEYEALQGDFAVPKFRQSDVVERETSLREFLRRELDITTREAEAELGGVTGLLDMFDYVRAAPKKPQTLLEFARKSGGIIDETGEFKASGIKFGRTGKDPISLDKFTELATEEGFYSTRPYTMEVLDDLVDDLNNKNFVRARDVGAFDDYITHRQMATEFDRYLDEAGLDAKEIKKSIEDFVRAERANIRKQRKGLELQEKSIREGAARVKEHFAPHLKKAKDAQGRLTAISKKLATIHKNRIKDATKRAEKRRERYREVIRQSDGTDELLAEEMYQKLSGISNQEIPHYIAPIEVGPMKAKLLDILDNRAEPFLENDISRVMHAYVRKMGSQVAFQRQFGNADLSAQIQRINDEFTDMMATTKTEKERLALADEHRQNVREIQQLRDILRGTFRNSDDPDGILANAATAIKDLQYMAKLGGVTVSSIPDTARVVMIHGMNRAFGDLLSKLTMPKTLKGIAKEDLEELGFNLEAVMGTRLSTLADVSDPFVRGSGLTKLTGQMAQGFSRLTLINSWNDIMKNFAAVTTQNRVFKNIEMMQAGKLGKDERGYLAYLGIDEQTARVLGDQFKKHGYKDGRAYIAGLKKWDATPEVQDALRVYKGALRKEADIIVVTKGVSDIPLFGHKQIGGLILQFKSFLFASHQRMLMRGLQQADMATMSGLLMSMSLGMMVAAVKKLERDVSSEFTGRPSNQEELEEWSAGKWFAEGLDRSGTLSLVLEANNIWEKAGGYGVTQALGQPPASRFASRNVHGALLGPTIGTIADTSSFVGTLSSPLTGRDVTESDIYSIRRIIPYQNLIGIRFLFDMIEGGINDLVD